jgi:hypothetical protein
VVETFMSLGRIVPAMMAVKARRGGAQCVEMCALRAGRAAGQMRVRAVEKTDSGGRATPTSARRSEDVDGIARGFNNDPR